MAKNFGEKGDDMIQMKGMLKEIVKSEEYEGTNAKSYYERMTKISWKDESLEFYEESLDRNEFVAHNTILTIFTDMDRDKEEQITETTKVKGENTMDATKPLKDHTKKELHEELTRKGIAYRVRDTKEALIDLLAGCNQAEEDRKKVVKEKEEEMKIIGIKKKDETPVEQHKEEIVEIEDLITQIRETATVHELIKGIRVLTVGVKEGGKGLNLIKRLYKVMESDFATWIIENKAFIEEQHRKYEKITKLKSVGKKSESKRTEKDDGSKKYKRSVSKEEEVEILEGLKGKKITEEILNGIGWRTLKKLAKERGVKSFGKSKGYITKRLLKNKNVKTKA